MYLRPIYFREFLEAVCIEEGPFRIIFGWPNSVVQKSMPSSHIFLPSAGIRTWILFSLRFS
jgi:hypothetical protein